MLRAYILPSLLSCDFGFLASESKRMMELGADRLHVDVMDGHFVNNLTLGAPIVKSLRKHTDAYLDCHLMVSDPMKWVPDFAAAGANGITFHVEGMLTMVVMRNCIAVSDPRAVIQAIRSHKMDVGISVKPNTPVEDILPYLDDIDMVLVMTVEPGFGGQSFMANMMPKVEKLRSLKPNLNIEVDGGIDESNIGVAAAAGANVIVAGSSIFKSKDPAKTIKILRDAVHTCIQK